MAIRCREHYHNQDYEENKPKETKQMTKDNLVLQYITMFRSRQEVYCCLGTYSHQFPHCILELLVPQAIDEGVQY